MKRYSEMEGQWLLSHGLERCQLAILSKYRKLVPLVIIISPPLCRLSSSAKGLGPCTVWRAARN